MICLYSFGKLNEMFSLAALIKGGGPMRVVSLCLFVCLSVCSNQVFAIPVTFDFTVSSSVETQLLSFQVGGIQLDITAADANGVVADVSQTRDGLGVYRGNSDSKVIDGAGVDDLLTLTFQTLVTLQQVLFSSIEEGGDSFLLQVDDGQSFASNLHNALFDFSYLNIAGREFVFSAVLDKADYRIEAMVVDVSEQMPVPTPEPSTWLLLGSGLAGLFFWQRKRSG